jgi:hypothetical protein
MKKKPKIKHISSRARRAVPQMLDVETFAANWNELLEAFSEGDTAYVARRDFKTDELAQYSGQRLRTCDW